MGKALYRKYRSKNLSEVVGQEHVTETLTTALQSDKISHAYLLTGPRGVGKTSIARILAHEVNGLPYSDQNHLDIIEIDAASNRRIDEIRDIRDKVRIAPTSAKYKVYIIDEVHMLTKEAFNALLKTLEEPPAHAIFILATTEANKLPETIISRTQRYSLKPITKKAIEEHLAFIAKQEKLGIDPQALELIARHSQGGLRDAISMLDQLSSKTEMISRSDVEQMLGIAPKDSIEQLATALGSNDAQELLSLLRALEEQGIHAAQIAHQLASVIKGELLAGKAPEGSLKLLGQLIDVPAASEPPKLLELVLLENFFNHQSGKSAPVALKEQAIEPDETPPTQDSVVVEKNSEEPVPETKPKRQTRTVAAGDLELLIAPDYWQSILHAVRKKHNTLYGVVRMAEPTIDGDVLKLCFNFPFHQKRMNEAKNRQLIQDVIAEATGINVSVVCVIAAAQSPSQATPKKDIAPKTPQDSGTLDTITDIFGGGEVLES